MYSNMKFYIYIIWNLQPNKPEATVEVSKTEVDQVHNITNLTAEIESFVRNADTDQDAIEETALKTDEGNNNRETKTNDEKHEKEKISRQSPESNDYYPQDDGSEEITIEKIQNLGATDINSNERSKRSPVKILIRAATDEEHIPTIEEEDLKQPENEEYEAKDTEREIVVVKTNCIIKAITHDEKLKTNDEIEETKEYVEAVKTIQDTEGTTTPTSSAVEFILENESLSGTNVTTLLKITESNDDLSEKSTTNEIHGIGSTTEEKTSVLERQCEPVNQSSNTLSRFEVRSIPLKLDSPTIRKKNVGVNNGANREPPTPPQRRRSVKEIIESINKCQSLLKVNQDLKTEKAKKDATKKRMFSDIAEINNNVRREDMSNIPLFVEKFNEFNNNNNPNSIFEKCVFRNDKPDEKINVEWNPLPKPRRHRNSTQGSIN